jgi:peptidoglycan/xylan/chitin deacetylase (PgdA/CDA1 family)
VAAFVAARKRARRSLMMLGALTSLASPSGGRARLTTFYFHRVLPQPDPLLPGEPDARRFDAILGWIGNQFRVLDPLDACERLYAGTLPARAAIVSFDDGYRNNFEIALPILQRHGMKAVVFVATAFLDGGCMFNDRVIEAVRRAAAPVLPGDAIASATDLPLRGDAERRAAISQTLDAIKGLPPDDRNQRVARIERALGAPAAERLMMDAREVAAMSRAGMHIGGHTRTHPILCALDDASATDEIAGGLDDLTAITGTRPRLFAYPNGRYGRDYDRRHVAMVDAAGCAYAFTTQPGAATLASNRLELPRFTPWARTRMRFGLMALRNLADAGARVARH